MGSDETGFQPGKAFKPKRLTEARRVLQAPARGSGAGQTCSSSLEA
jgi:hypothetical protein